MHLKKYFYSLWDINYKRGDFMKRKTKTYVACILLTLAVGVLSAFLTKNNMDVYETINKPPLAPAGFLFPIVWGILYVIMGISIAGILINEITYISAILDITDIWVLRIIVRTIAYIIGVAGMTMGINAMISLKQKKKPEDVSPS